jgi:hypothetical protein
MKRFGALLLASGWLLTAVAYAQGYTPVRPVKTLSGWQCMSLASVYGPKVRMLLRCPSTTVPLLARHESAPGLV